MTTVYDAIQQIQEVVGAVSGIRFAPDSPPNQVAHFPAAICYSRAADWSRSDATFYTALHSVVIEVHFPKEDLARAVALATPYGDLIVSALLSAFKAGTFTAFQSPGSITGEFGPMEWDSTETVGWRLVLTNIKIQGSVA